MRFSLGRGLILSLLLLGVPYISLALAAENTDTSSSDKTNTATADEEGLPDYTVLSCKGKCGDFIPPVAIKKSKLRLSATDGPYQKHPYGTAVLNVYIDAQGKVSDVTIVSQTGAHSFAEKAANSIRRSWTFQPATRNGTPVESNYRVAPSYYVMPTATRSTEWKAADAAIERSQTLWKEKKNQEAISTLQNTLSQEKIPYLQLARAYYTLSQYLYFEKNRIDALYYVRSATYSLAPQLNSEMWRTIIPAHIKLAAELGEMKEAINIANGFGKKYKRDADMEKTIAYIISTVNGSQPIPVYGKIRSKFIDYNEQPFDTEKPKWTHDLMRHTFYFTDVKGKLDNFILNCDQETIKSGITSNAQWVIPSGHTNCSLIVYGQRDTTFRLIESKG